MLLNSIYYGKIPIERVYKSKQIIWSFGIDFFLDLKEALSTVVGETYLNQNFSKDLLEQYEFFLKSKFSLSSKVSRNIDLDFLLYPNSSSKIFMHPTLTNFKTSFGWQNNPIFVDSVTENISGTILTQEKFYVSQKNLTAKSIEDKHFFDLIVEYKITNGIASNIKIEEILSHGLDFKMNSKILESVSLNVNNISRFSPFIRVANSLTEPFHLEKINYLLNKNNLISVYTRLVNGSSLLDLREILTFYNGISKNMGENSLISPVLTKFFLIDSKTNKIKSLSSENFLNEDKLVISHTKNNNTININKLKLPFELKSSLTKELKSLNNFLFYLNSFLTSAQTAEEQIRLLYNALIFSKITNSITKPVIKYLEYSLKKLAQGKILPSIPIEYNKFNIIQFSGSYTNAASYDLFLLKRIISQNQSKLQNKKPISFNLKVDYTILGLLMPYNKKTKFLMLNSNTNNSSKLKIDSFISKKTENFNQISRTNSQANLYLRFSSFYNFLQLNNFTGNLNLLNFNTEHLFVNSYFSFNLLNSLNNFNSINLRDINFNPIVFSSNFNLDCWKTEGVISQNRYFLVLSSIAKNGIIKTFEKEKTFSLNLNSNKVKNCEIKVFNLLEEKNNLKDFMKVTSLFTQKMKQFQQKIKSESRVVLSMEKRTWTYPQSNGPGNLIIYQAVKADLINNTLVII